MKQEQDTHNGKQKKMFNLLDVAFVGNIINSRLFKPVVHLIGVAFLVVIIFLGLSSEPDLRFPGGIPFANTLIWDIWHPFLAFTVLLLGRLWCFACPIGALGDWGQAFFSLKKEYPTQFRNLWLAIILFLIVFAGEPHLFKFTKNPQNTAYLLLFFTILAVGMGLIFEKRSFCRYLCPIGLVIGIFSMLSMVELRSKSESVCRNHKNKGCVTGNEKGKGCPVGEFLPTMNRNNYCILCMECVKACSQKNIRISLRLPGRDIIQATTPHPAEAFFIHSIIVIFLFVLGMERLPFRNTVIDFVKYTLPYDSVTFLDLYWRNMWAIVVYTAITMGAAGLMYFAVGSTLPGENTRKRFVDLSSAFVPLGLAVYLIGNMFAFLKGLFLIIGKSGRTLGQTWEFNIGFAMINSVQIAFLIAGVASTLYAGYLISQNKWENVSTVRQGALAVTLMAAVYLVVGMWILTLPIV